jgi:hypothetical protein
MSYIRGISKTITLSTLGSAVALSTLDLNGLVESVFLQTNKAMGVGARVNVTTTSTAKVILTVKPSTLGSIYYPAAKAQTTTGGVMGSSTPAAIPLVDERIRVAVTSSSGKAGGVITFGLTCQ